MSWSGVLELVMVPTYCSMLKGSRKNHNCTCAQYLCVFYQLSGVIGITGQFVDLGVSLRNLCNFLDCEGENDVFFAAIGKYRVHGGLVYCRLLCNSMRCIVVPTLGEGHPGFPVILCRAVIQRKDSICDCVVDRAILFQE